MEPLTRKRCEHRPSGLETASPTRNPPTWRTLDPAAKQLKVSRRTITQRYLGRQDQGLHHPPVTSTATSMWTRCASSDSHAQSNRRGKDRPGPAGAGRADSFRRPGNVGRTTDIRSLRSTARCRLRSTTGGASGWSRWRPSRSRSPRTAESRSCAVGERYAASRAGRRTVVSCPAFLDALGVTVSEHRARIACQVQATRPVGRRRSEFGSQAK